MRGIKKLVAGLAVATGTMLPGLAVADNGLVDRLGSLMGQERRSLDIVPEERLSALTMAPPAAERGAEPGVPGLSYDPAWLAAQPAASGGAQWECLTEALYFEARGESVRGLFAVAEVILNRVDSPDFPDTVCGVVHQGTGARHACQFTYTCDGNPEEVHEPAAWSRVGKVARLMLDGAPRGLTDGATHYHTRAVSPNWAARFPRTRSIGAHHFYRMPTRTAMN